MASVPVDAPSSHAIKSYYGSKLEDLEVTIREKTQNLARLSAQRNALNTRGNSCERAAKELISLALSSPLPPLRIAVRQLREELQLLQEPGSYIGEIVKAMGKTKVLVKCGQEGKYVSDIDKVCIFYVFPPDDMFYFVALNMISARRISTSTFARLARVLHCVATLTWYTESCPQRLIPSSAS